MSPPLGFMDFCILIFSKRLFACLTREEQSSGVLPLISEGKYTKGVQNGTHKDTARNDEGRWPRKRGPSRCGSPSVVLQYTGAPNCIIFNKRDHE